jgi:hypothetical protein
MRFFHKRRHHNLFSLYSYNIFFWFFFSREKNISFAIFVLFVFPIWLWTLMIQNRSDNTFYFCLNNDTSHCSVLTLGRSTLLLYGCLRNGCQQRGWACGSVNTPLDTPYAITPYASVDNSCTDSCLVSHPHCIQMIFFSSKTLFASFVVRVYFTESEKS